MTFEQRLEENEGGGPVAIGRETVSGGGNSMREGPEVGLCGSVRKAAERPVGQEWRALEESRHGGQAVCAWPWLWH